MAKKTKRELALEEQERRIVGDLVTPEMQKARKIEREVDAHTRMLVKQILDAGDTEAQVELMRHMMQSAFHDGVKATWKGEMENLKKGLRSALRAIELMEAGK